MPGKPVIARHRPRRAQRPGIESFLHRDVEIRTRGGGSYRGELVSVDGSFLCVLRANGREVLIPRSAVVAIVDEQRLPSAAGVLVSREVREP